MGRAGRLVSFVAVAGFALVAMTQTQDVFAQSKEPAPAAKAERAAARDAYDAGTVAFEKGDYVAALDNFVKANGIIESPHAMYWIARSFDKLDRSDDAISGYQAVLAHAGVEKLGEEKIAMAKERLQALQAQQASPPEPAGTGSPEPVEPNPAPAPVEPAPAPAEPAPPVAIHRDGDDLKPQKNVTELGIFTGPLFLSPAHNLLEPRFPHTEYSTLSWLVGIRAAFFPAKVLGIEAEWGHGWGKAEPPQTFAGQGDDSASAQFDAIRGHLIGQLPSSRVVPFALLGAGVLRAKSSRMGADTDFLLELGGGLKVRATKLLAPRLDLRLDLTQKKGGGFADGVAVHGEAHIGLSFVLGS